MGLVLGWMDEGGQYGGGEEGEGNHRMQRQR